MESPADLEILGKNGIMFTIDTKSMKNNKKIYSSWPKWISLATAVGGIVFLFLGTSCESSSARSILSIAKGYTQGRSPLLSAILANDIVFYGQVLDLEGNPVPNAKISYSSLNSGNFDDVWTGGGPPNKIMYTDGNGYFEIHEIGGSLFVACEHQDYYGTYNPSANLAMVSRWVMIRLGIRRILPFSVCIKRGFASLCIIRVVK